MYTAYAFFLMIYERQRQTTLRCSPALWLEHREQCVESLFFYHMYQEELQFEYWFFVDAG